MHSKKKEDHFEDFFSDISSTLEDLCQSGFHTVHDSTLQELKERGETAAEYGMQHLSNLLLALREELSGSRHRVSVDRSKDSLCAKYYTELVTYMELGREKTAYDRGKNYYLAPSEEARPH